MTKWMITCDRDGDIGRAAVWQGKTLCDLYVDNLTTPDFSGATARGKIVRLLAGNKAGWIECGLSEKVYIESSVPLKAGALVSVRILCTQDHGKAWRGALIKDAADGEMGLITPPPQPWKRALAGLKADDKALLRFADRADFEAFGHVTPDARFVADFVAKEPVHDGLDEIIDGLLDPVVPLREGGALVIEPTEALVAIDVNGGEATNLTALNLVAVREGARQLRLRNLCGIIVIDCLKMKERADASKVMNAFARVAEGDPANVQFISMSKLGLLECTRERKGPALGKIIKEEVVCVRP